MFDDRLVERLELEPAGNGRSYYLARVKSGFVRDMDGWCDSFRHHLSVATAIHGDEPPSGFVDGLADREEAVILQDSRFAIAESGGNAIGFVDLRYETSIGAEQGMVFIESTSVLGDGIEEAAERGPRFPIHRMSMGRANHVGTSRVHAGVDGEGRAIDQMVARDDVTAFVNKDQIGDADLAKVHAEGIDPEMVEQLRISGGDVARDSLIESIMSKKAESGGQTLFAMLALFGQCREHWRGWHSDVLLNDGTGHSGL